jgi:hypothetical protein
MSTAEAVMHVLTVVHVVVHIRLHDVLPAAVPTGGRQQETYSHVEEQKWCERQPQERHGSSVKPQLLNRVHREARKDIRVRIAMVDLVDVRVHGGEVNEAMANEEMGGSPDRHQRQKGKSASGAAQSRQSIVVSCKPHAASGPQVAHDVLTGYPDGDPDRSEGCVVHRL